MTSFVSWTASFSNNGTFAGVEVLVIVSAAGAMDAVNEGAELCAVTSVAQAREKMNAFGIFTGSAEHQRRAVEVRQVR